jgi:hypothetical protein
MNLTLTEFADILEEIAYSIETNDTNALRHIAWMLLREAEKEVEEDENE